MKVQIILNLNGLLKKPHADAWERYFAGAITKEQALKEISPSLDHRQVAGAGISEAQFNMMLAYMVEQAKNDDLNMYGVVEVDPDKEGKRRVEIEVYGGLVSDVKGLPKGWTYKVKDLDVERMK